ncbi:unnamed protein product [marine sediment metagenome]|uniref:Uncharacterized protein n=1 Tax=marine sediment metagenome TaxID=412755 RepID=X1M2A5_9ZZZZ
MRALEDVVIGWQEKSLFQKPFCFSLIDPEKFKLSGGLHLLKIIAGEFYLTFILKIFILKVRIPLEIEDVFHPLKAHSYSLQTIGQLN